MTFDVAADAYGRFMGRYADPLAEQLLALAPVRSGQRALDVGCGPGAVTARLVERLGPHAVAAIDPSEPFVAVVSERWPGVEVHRGVAEELPFEDGSFDAAFAQLVVHFMSDPVRGLREMGRVVRDGGVVVASVWDYAGGRAPLSAFWSAVHDLDSRAVDESGLPGAREGDLVELADRAGLHEIVAGVLTVAVRCESFEEWWEPYMLGVGPAGDYVTRLGDPDRAALRALCAERLPAGPFTVRASAWTVVAHP